MGVRISDLPERVQPIARQFAKQGSGAFAMTDILAAGLLFLENRSPDEVFGLIQIARSVAGAPAKVDELVVSIEAANAKGKRARRAKPAKSG